MRATALFAGALLAAACATPTGQEQAWHEVESEHVRLFSSGRPEVAVQVARRLELFHVLGRELLGEQTVEERTPTFVYLLDPAIWFETLGQSVDSRGILVPHPQANYIAIQAFSDPEEALSIAQNLYARVIQQTRSGSAYPRWYESGIGELLSTVEVNDDHVLIGRVPFLRRGLLERGFRARNQRGPQRGSPTRATWVQLHEVMSAGSISRWPRESRRMFYAESWALAFYLSWKRPRELATYLDEVLAGQTHDQAFETAFGGSHYLLEQQLQRFFQGRQRLWRLPRERFEVRAEPKVRGLETHRWLVRLGELLIARQLPEQSAHAELAFQGSLANGPELPEAHAGLAAALAFQRKPGGDRHIERALELAPVDARTRLRAGEYFLERVRGSAQVDPELLARARTELESALDLASDLAGAHYALGQSYLLPGEDTHRAIAPLERAHALMPWQRDIALALGEAHVRTGGTERAHPILLAVARGTARDHTRRRAEELLAQIERASEPH